MCVCARVWVWMWVSLQEESWREALVVHVVHVAARKQVMLLPRYHPARCGNDMATAIDTKTTPAFLAMIPLNKDPLCQQVEVCEAEALCEAVVVVVVECTENVVPVEELQLHLPLHIRRLNHQILGKGY